MHTGIARNITGFTLVEVMIAIALIAVLAGIALPAYQNYAKQGRIAEAASTLLSLAAKMEGRYLENRSYADANGQCISQASNDNYFVFDCNFPEGDTQRYLLSATSTAQFDSSTTLILKLNDQGSRTTEVIASDNSHQEFSCWLNRIEGECR